MLCENCKKNIANTYFKQTVNGKTNEIFLCSECASKMGLNSITSDFGLDGFFPQFFGRSEELPEASCQSCGISFKEIMQKGKVGCAKCYDTFKDKLAPAIYKIHGNKKHIGKVPGSIENKQYSQIEKLKRQLDEAVRSENFEQAAVLRDQIKQLEYDKNNK
jgi:protein arginine kinase activator